MTIRVLHLVGSAVSEFLSDLSLVYARDCLGATADPARYEFHVALVSPDGQWRFPADLGRAAIQSARPMPLAAAIDYLAALRPDVAIPQMFCIPGMTTFRSLLDLMGIPFVGNTADVMALTVNKSLARAVVAAAGIPVPRGQVLRRGQRPTVGPPAVVKPVDGDNSLGVTLVRTESDYDAALANAFAHSDGALVESFVELGREVRCGIVVQQGELICLPLEEYQVDSVSKPIRLPADKISRNADGALNLVAKDITRAWIVDTDDPLTQRVWEMAKRCHLALGCRHYSLFDFRIDPSGQPSFLEAGLYCSFAKSSVLSTMARAAGMPLDNLFHSAIAESARNITEVGRRV
jgi:D-alanine-D-alanine ligase